MVYHFIIMLSFLISIISQSYDTIMSKSLEVTYSTRANIVAEQSYIAQAFGLKHVYEEASVYIISSSNKYEQEDSVTKGFIRPVKTLIEKKSTAVIAKIDSNYEDHHNKIKHEIRGVRAEIKNMKSILTQSMKRPSLLM